VICPYCDHTYTKVLETRVMPQQTRWTKRQRVCFNCTTRFFTLEMPMEDVTLETDTPEPTDDGQ
jgi:transcriptional regulator NrdR family protein